MGGYQSRMRYSSPTWLQDDTGNAWNDGVGAGLDELFSDYKDGIRARFPTYAAANADSYALACFGSDSSLPRYPAETDTEYGVRLQARWQTYARSGAAEKADGTGCPIKDALEGMGFGDVVIMEYLDWPADADNPQVHHSPPPIYDNGGVLGIMVLGEDLLGSPWWSRFWVFVGTYNGAPIPSGGVLGTGVLGEMILGFDLPSDVVASARTACLQWKPAYVQCAYLAFLTDGTTTDSVLGIGVLGEMVLGATGSGTGVAVIEINQ